MLSTLFTNDVRQTLDQFRRSVDQMFDNFYGPVTTPLPLSAESTHGRSARWWSLAGTIII